jgi:hypothetical protein
MKKVKKTKVSTEKVVHENSNQTTSNFDFKNVESQLESLITKNLPALPSNIVETLVKISPWLAVIGTVMGVPAILALLKLNQFAAYYNVPGMGFGWSYQASNLLLIVQMVLTGLSIQGLFAHKMSAWRLMYYAAWVSAISSLISSGIVSMLIGGLISFYILFQVKKSYK